MRIKRTGGEPSDQEERPKNVGEKKFVGQRKREREREKQETSVWEDERKLIEQEGGKKQMGKWNKKQKGENEEKETNGGKYKEDKTRRSPRGKQMD